MVEETLMPARYAYIEFDITSGFWCSLIAARHAWQRGIERCAGPIKEPIGQPHSVRPTRKLLAAWARVVRLPFFMLYHVTQFISVSFLLLLVYQNSSSCAVIGWLGLGNVSASNRTDIGRRQQCLA